MSVNYKINFVVLILLSMISFSWLIGGVFYPDMYGIPSLLLIILFIFISNDNLKYFLNCLHNNIFIYRKIIITIFFIISFLHLTTSILRFFSFDYATWDVGVHSNMLYNFSNGEFYSSFLSSHYGFNVNSLADHFALSMYPLGWLYVLYPSTLWLVTAKSIFYLVCPIFFYVISKKISLSHKQSIIITFILSLFWLCTYKPPLNGLHYEFQPSSLALPFIFVSFYFLSSKKWIAFFVTMIFLLGFKEHLGLVWLGFGLYLMINDNKIAGLVLCTIGLFSIYAIMFQLMPYLRDYRPNWSLHIGPFDDLQKKLLYIFRIYAPFGFLHFIRWKFGIMTFPLVGANLLFGSNKSSVYSMTTHYDDILSCMLFISIILIFKEIYEKKYLYKYFSKWFLIIWLIIFFSDLHRSPIRYLSLRLPKKDHFILAEEIKNFDSKNRDKKYAVQGHLGTHFNRKEIEEFRQYKFCGKKQDGENLLNVDYIALSSLVSHAWSINNFNLCLLELSNLDNFERIDSFKQLIVFKNNQSHML